MKRIEYGRFDAVLFDLDGTLVDTAPDMVRVLIDLQLANNVKPTDYAAGRCYVSNGAAGLLRHGFESHPKADLDALQTEFLANYATRLTRNSALFSGLDLLLSHLEEASVPWGVVTNKPGHLTEPLMQQLSLFERAACIVSGDTLDVKKPDPAPMHHACRIAKVEPTKTLYVGDAARDIDAGRAAGMTTIAAAYGYITDGDNAADWGADLVVENPQELAREVLKAVTLNT